MKLEEFEERIFDVINESDEICISDLKIFDKKGGLAVTVADGSRFVVKCFSVDPRV